MSVLHRASEHGHGEVAELLLRRATDVHCPSKLDAAPFNISTDANNAEAGDTATGEGSEDRSGGGHKERQADVQTGLRRQQVGAAQREKDRGKMGERDVMKRKEKTRAERKQGKELKGKPEDVRVAESVHVVGDKVQRVITIVMDQHSSQ
ncbi:hypothetical protein Q5P01_011790 [Channa striata]|uniref:Uncharacterized protein n=1 Tax=Channa striata TaxID=64152 RepID=A0AA88MUA8_CHASR|nr:hypothetical protein Q5P01_011790 [Channa striata]